jgi:SpoIIAA-like
MIEIIEGLPDNVVGIIVKGRLTKKDCAEILVPKLKKALDWHYKLRLYYEIRSRFPGAAWEAIDLGLDHVAWERVAIVTDVASVRHTVQALRLLIPGDIQVFETSRMAQGLAWITARDSREPHEAPRRRRRIDVSLPTAAAGDGNLSFRPAPQYLSDRANPV